VEWSRLASSRDLHDLFNSDKFKGIKAELRRKLEDSNGPVGEHTIGYIRGYLKCLKDVESMASSMATAEQRVVEAEEKSGHLDTLRRTLSYRRTG
jgi:hypothetical protein